MRDAKQRAAAKNFAAAWKDRGYEKGESQPFWLALLRDVFAVAEPEKLISFEDQVRLDKTSFIDASIPSTHVLIEQKSLTKDLHKLIRQSDGSLLDPFQQAKRYATELPYSQRPRYIVTCNFASFLVYDMENPSGAPEEILLANLPREYYRLAFLVDGDNAHLKREMELSIQAGDIVGVLYDEILKHYHDPTADQTLKSLNMLCVRLVFCLYAEDAGIFGNRNQFHDYLSRFEARDLRKALLDLFKVLDTKIEDRDPYLDDALAAFPYVNGELFADERIEVPMLDERVKELLLAKASDDFDWSDISPTIFGAVFESTLNPQTRRAGGMHYTSIENIHKVIDPLFLDVLKAELKDIKAMKTIPIRLKRLKNFQEKLAGLNFLDPACGSGNFLTETYLSLRRLENEVLSILNPGQAVFNIGDVIKVSISQFYGIEINDFAVTVAKTALWIAESQMMKETEDVVHMDLDFLPLKSFSNIVEANALRIDWQNVVPKEKLTYIMGNPPFVGKKEQSTEQKVDLLALYGCRGKGTGNLDYVTGWYIKAVQYMNGTDIHTAFVSTNSITQGEQAATFWKLLFNQHSVTIDFAYRTFRWDSEANCKAHVHCVIIGFRIRLANEVSSASAVLFTEDGRKLSATNINAYLADAPNVFIESRNTPINGAPPIMYGSMPIDDGHLILSKEDVESLLSENADNIKMIRRYAGGAELIRNSERWCLWLKGISPKLIQQSAFVKDRIKQTEVFRRSSRRSQTLALANYPSLFGEIRQPETEMLVLPKVSSENRKYLPISFVSPDIIINGSALMIQGVTSFHFGILSSNVHNAWMRTVCGRMKSDYQYSNNIVYNNFPWPSTSAEQQAQIASTAQGILDARALYADCSLADLYDEAAMPIELRQAHQTNDRAVMKAYGFSTDMTEPDIVAQLMKRYQLLTGDIMP